MVRASFFASRFPDTFFFFPRYSLLHLLCLLAAGEGPLCSTFVCSLYEPRGGEVISFSLGLFRLHYPLAALCLCVRALSAATASLTGALCIMDSLRLQLHSALSALHLAPTLSCRLVPAVSRPTPLHPTRILFFFFTRRLSLPRLLCSY